MRTDEIEQWRPVLQALLDGKTIQYKPSADIPWRDMGGNSNYQDISLLYSPECYRVKPEPETPGLELLGAIVRRKHGSRTARIITAVQQRDHNPEVYTVDYGWLNATEMYNHFERYNPSTKEWEEIKHATT